MNFLLIKDGVVVNAIVADQEFVDQIKDQYDAVIEFENKEGDPGVGWKHDGKNFSEPDKQIPTQKDLINQKLSNIEFGISCVAELAVFNDQRKLSDDGRLLFLKLMADVSDLFSAGDIAGASKAVSKIPVDGKIITQNIIDSTKAKLDEYLKINQIFDAAVIAVPKL